MARPLFAALLGLVVAGMTLPAGCVATPLPTPPNARADRFGYAGGGAGDPAGQVRGGASAIEPPGARIRLTAGPDPMAIRVLERVETVVREDGSFGPVTLVTSVARVYYVEVLTEERDELVLTFRLGPGDGVTEVAPGPDRDGDDSPDDIDCAPDDPTVGGQRC